MSKDNLYIKIVKVPPKTIWSKEMRVQFNLSNFTVLLLKIRHIYYK